MIVFIEGEQVEIREPSPATLKKYGLSLNEWKEIISSQGYRCPVCKRVLGGRTVIDHLHVKGWKDLPPNLRKMYVRGISDWRCNYFFLEKTMTLERAKNLVEYLEDFGKRRHG